MPAIPQPTLCAPRFRCCCYHMTQEATPGKEREREKKRSAANQAPPLPRAAPSSTKHTQLAARCRPRVRTMMYSSPRQLVGCPHRGPRASRLQTSHWRQRRLPRSPTAQPYK